MIGRFDHNFMRAHAVHLVKHSVRLAVQVTLNSQGGEFIRHHAQVPPGGVRARILARTVSQYLWRRCAFISGTKRAEPALEDDALAGEISGTLGTVSGNNHPASGNRIFSQLRHSYYLTTQAIYREDIGRLDSRRAVFATISVCPSVSTTRSPARWKSSLLPRTTPSACMPAAPPFTTTAISATSARLSPWISCAGFCARADSSFSTS